MSDEITVTQGLSVTKGNLRLAIPSRTERWDLAGSKKFNSSQVIGTANEALITGDIATAGAAMFTNLDATNFVDVGTQPAGTFNPFLRLYPGETSGPLHLATLALYAQANVASVTLDYTLVDH